MRTICACGIPLILITHEGSTRPIFIAIWTHVSPTRFAIVASLRYFSNTSLEKCTFGISEITLELSMIPNAPQIVVHQYITTEVESTVEIEEPDDLGDGPWQPSAGFRGRSFLMMLNHLLIWSTLLLSNAYPTSFISWHS